MIIFTTVGSNIKDKLDNNVYIYYVYWQTIHEHNS
jgi:hypothetical protein